MGNLVATPWEERNINPGFGYAGGFDNILSAFNGLTHRTAKKRYGTHQPLFEEQIEHLKTLKEELEVDEENFFKMFGIYNKDKSICFKQLQDKIDKWNATGAWKLITDASVGNEFYIGLDLIKRQAVFAEISDEEWETLLIEGLELDETGKVKEMLASNPDTNVAELLNVVLSDNGLQTLRTKGNSTLLVSVVVGLNEEGEIQVKTDRNKLTPNMQLKLKERLEKLMARKKKKVKPNYDFKQMFKDLFARLGISSEGQKYITMALGNFSNVLESYAFSSNDSQIKGFLGEVYNNAFLMYMASNGGNISTLKRITPTGVIQNFSGEEIIIDTWLDGFGIQVKNYEKNNILNKGFNTHKTYNAEHFIYDVLQLDSTGTAPLASVGDILLNFFTANEFNKDYGKIDPKVKSTDAYKYWKTSRVRMDNKYGDSSVFSKIFLPYVDKILGIDKAFESKDGTFVLSEDVSYFRNTFFNISGHYIPSSLIIEAIINSLEKTENDPLKGVVSAYFNAKYNPGNKPAWNPAITDSDVIQLFGQRGDYAQTTSISYSITLNVQKMIDIILPTN